MKLKSFVIIFLPIALVLSLGAPAWAGSEKTIRERIEKKVTETPSLSSASEVVVSIGDGVVVLSGAVRLYEQKMAYEKIAWQAAGVDEVENEIEVIPQFPVTDKAIQRQVKEILKKYKRFHTAQLTVAVEQGLVSIKGAFIHPNNVIFLKHKVAEIQGVVAIDMRATFKA